MEENQSKKAVFGLIILILLLTAFFFVSKYFSLQKELKETKTFLETQKINEKTLEFAKFFTKNVLKAEKEVDFETRLKLENAVRNLNDEEILSQWQKFTESQTEIEAQNNVKDLLEMLINKIKIQ